MNVSNAVSVLPAANAAHRRSDEPSREVLACGNQEASTRRRLDQDEAADQVRAIKRKLQSHVAARGVSYPMNALEPQMVRERRDMIGIPRSFMKPRRLNDAMRVRVNLRMGLIKGECTFGYWRSKAAIGLCNFGGAGPAAPGPITFAVRPSPTVAMRDYGLAFAPLGPRSRLRVGILGETLCATCSRSYWFEEQPRWCWLNGAARRCEGPRESMAPA
jgi:hypothetical protein